MIIKLNKNKKVFVGMSGGVDSSVAAALLKKAGYEVVGIFMKFWQEETCQIDGVKQRENKCCSVDSYEDARRVAQLLEIPLYTMNMKQPFKKAVVDNFLEEYSQGKTPNPCIRCNKYIKFGEFLKKAKKLGADYIATGHYVKNYFDGKKYHLLRAKDLAKDQSYFLYNLKNKDLAKILFPIGEFNKPVVRAMAKKLKLPVFQKRDSQEICFVPEKEHNEFLKRHLSLKSGDIVDLAGVKLGQHKGLALYTLGQRKGVGLSGGPYYVARKDFKKNQLVVTNEVNDLKLLTNNFSLKEVTWVNAKPRLPLKCLIKIRYLHQAENSIIRLNKGKITVELTEPTRAVTPGQSAVFYSKIGGELEVLGGGVII